MALPCGHFIEDQGDRTAASKVERVEAGECPACRVRLGSPDPRGRWVGQCPCCESRFVVRDGTVRYYLPG